MCEFMVTNKTDRTRNYTKTHLRNKSKQTIQCFLNRNITPSIPCGFEHPYQITFSFT